MTDGSKLMDTFWRRVPSPQPDRLRHIEGEDTRVFTAGSYVKMVTYLSCKAQASLPDWRHGH